MSKYTFTFSSTTGLETVSYWAQDLMEATSNFYNSFGDAVIVMTERIEA